MRLTRFSDYALRLMMFAAARPQQHVTIEEAAKILRLSRAHLMKIANTLTKTGHLKAVRGRKGGLLLGKSAEHIGLGEIVRATEPDFSLVECFASGNQCNLTRRCRLTGILALALADFLAVLDRHTLADLLLKPEDFGLKAVA